MLINDGDYCNDHEIPARTGGGGAGELHPHALTLYLPIRKIYSNYPILLRLVFWTIIN